MLVEYEGTKYHGFQIQQNVPTVQGELERAIHDVTGETVRLKGAGRTDAGVHALGQVVAFKTETALSEERLVKALNYHLPRDIAAKEAAHFGESFDPRRDAISRAYRYTLLNSPARSPISRMWAHWVPEKLNTDAMNTACEVLIGEHDFSAFTNNEGAMKNTTRAVFKAEIKKHDDFIIFDLIANAFLPQQVRRTVGSLVKVGLGKLQVSEFQEMAGSGEVGKAKFVAPPHGLCLCKVKYSEIGFRNENL